MPELLEKGVADYRQLIVSTYRVIYAIRTEFIDIVSVIDGRRDIPAALLQRLLR